MIDNWEIIIGIVETALELIPDSISKQLVQKESTKSNTSKKQIMGLLDVSSHHQWMSHLKNPGKRGRPDILHRVLLSILDSPLNHLKKVSVIIETINGQLLWVRNETRIPRDYSRLCGVILNSFTTKPTSLIELFRHINTDSFPENQWILPLTGTLKDFIELWRPSIAISLTEQGVPISILELSKELQKSRRPMVLVGGFQKGTISPHIIALSNRQYRVYSDSFPSSIVISRVLGGLEIIFGLDRVQE